MTGARDWWGVQWLNYSGPNSGPSEKGTLYNSTPKDMAQGPFLIVIIL